jgi:hypothetical protein
MSTLRKEGAENLDIALKVPFAGGELKGHGRHGVAA